jgi:hypothetical protein
MRYNLELTSAQGIGQELHGGVRNPEPSAVQRRTQSGPAGKNALCLETEERAPLQRQQTSNLGHFLQTKATSPICAVFYSQHVLPWCPQNLPGWFREVDSLPGWSEWFTHYKSSLLPTFVHQESQEWFSLFFF